ncbi:UDP-N-acetylglucosamine 2-epimerase [Kribbella sp.]|uniref:UDP-N-acetylglucosamine 2-epimerase n=1 Tax=Kribbella sp. TaxID=1871183 RepID=UPI002D709045|nr:UDP-N-acetylglucosamine 2-epimerase [Kribbella sp.]HZX08248.1 UDP-N-acetylglucosamine 2-epimerase [Kribbella sp.]
MTARRVCVFTGSRADYGPLTAVLHALHDDPAIDLRVLVSGSHLVPQPEMTLDAVAADGFPINENVPMLVASDTPVGVATSFGLGAMGYAGALERIAPDIVVLLGDRYEVLAAAVAATFLRIPIAHICGGEVTAGSTDEGMRHAITKLSHLHFTATAEFSHRVVQLGEDPRRVHTVGSPGLDTVRTTKLLNRAEVSAVLDIDLGTPTVLVTYHPATADPAASRAGVKGLLAALDRLGRGTFVFTGPNADLGGPTAGEELQQFVRRRPGRTVLRPSLGQRTYLSLVKQSDVVVGNSSSGLIEVPALGTPTVNIGSRQEGRPTSESTINCSESAESIFAAIQLALTPEHRARARTGESPYGDGYAAGRILDIIKTIPLEKVTKKRFRDLEV